MTLSKLWDDPLGFLWQLVRTRPARLVFYLIVTATLFPSARFILVWVLLLSLAVLWIRDYRRTRSTKIFYLAGAFVLIVISYGITCMDVERVDQMRLASNPWGAGIKLVADGKYTGRGDGFRGPITVRVDVKDHKIVDVKTLEYPDLISVEDNEIAAYRRELLEKGRLEPPGQPELYRGAIVTLTGYANAVESALSKGIAGYPQYSAFSRFFSRYIPRQSAEQGHFERPCHIVRRFHCVRVRPSVNAHPWDGSLHQLLQLRHLCGRMPCQGSRGCSDAHGSGSPGTPGRL